MIARRINWLGFLPIAFCFMAACQKERITLPLAEIQLPTDIDIADVKAWDEQRLLAVGGLRWQKGLVLRSSDGGQTWSLDSLINTDFTRLFLDGSFAAATVHSTSLFTSIDSGFTWQSQRFPFREAFQGLAFSSSGAGVVVGGINYHDGCVYHFPGQQQGSDWVLDSMFHELNDVVYLDENTLVAVGYGIATRSDDGGQTWQPADVQGDMYKSVHFPSDNVGYAVGYYGSIIKTEDGGRNWQKLRNGNGLFVSRERFRDVFFVNEQIGYIVGENGTFWRTLDGGGNWAVVEGIPGGIHLYSVTVRDGVGLIGASEGKVFRF